MGLRDSWTVPVNSSQEHCFPEAYDKTARVAESDQNEFVSGLWGRVRLKFVVGAIRERNKCSCGPCSQIWCFTVFVCPPEDKTAKAEVQQAPSASQQALDDTQLPSGHPSLATSQGAASKCPFLAAQMSQMGSNVFRKASLELQEDVQEMHAVRKGKQGHGPGTESSRLFLDPEIYIRAIIRILFV